MSRSYKKIAAGTNWSRSQKKGKSFSSRAFRRISNVMTKLLCIDKLPFKQIEVKPSWDLGGDGKRIYKSDNKEDIKKWKRK